MPCLFDSEPAVGLHALGMPMTAEDLRWHKPVMVNEVLGCLNPQAGKVVVDGTAGTGGHAIAIASKLLPNGRLIVIDRDRSSLELARERLTEFSPIVTAVCDNYRNLPEILNSSGLQKVDGVLLDLGMSSPQVDQAQRGFSFLKEGPLDMRMDQSQSLTAAQWVNAASQDELEEGIRTFGEERFARRIAQRIGRERTTQAISSTKQLADLVAQAVPAAARYGRIHPATRTFQALRMIVNDELGALESALEALPGLLNPGARAVIITFHSLEDRMVKQVFRRGADEGLWRLLSKKVIKPSDEECSQNSRARSAKLRAVERC